MPVATNATGLSGIFNFAGIHPGSYRLVETNPLGFYSSADSQGGNDDQILLTLLSGEASSGHEFFDVQNGSIRGAVFEDVNGDGTRDPADTNGLVGVVILLTDTNGVPVSTNTTGPGGGFTFSDLPPGTYLVRETNPFGFLSTEDSDGNNDDLLAVSILSSEVSVSHFFLDTRPGMIRGFVFEDANGDGVFDPQDTNGLPLTSMVLADTNGAAVATTMVDLFGAYSFTNIAPGSYEIVSTNLPGFASTVDTSPPNDDRIPVSLISGGDEAGNNFLDVQGGTIFGSVFEDVDGDGVFDPEDTNGLSGVTIVLADTNGLPITTNSTDGLGGYVFLDILPGQYLVIESNLPGFLSTADRDGGDFDQILMQLQSGEALGGNNFMDLNPPSISGYVLNDIDGDGFFDPEDTNGVLGATMVLSGFTTNLPTLTNMTDSAGAYSFVGLLPGSYLVEQTAPVGFVPTGDRDGGSVVVTFVAVVSGENSVSNDFLDVQLAGIGGRVLVDQHADGNFDAEDSNGVSNVVLDLFDEQLDAFAAGPSYLGSSTTDVNGVYVFLNLSPAAYRVAVNVPGGYFDTGDSDGGSSVEIDVNLPSGIFSGNHNFLIAQPGLISGSVLEDQHADGVFDLADSNGLANATVVLSDSNGMVVASQIPGYRGGTGIGDGLIDISRIKITCACVYRHRNPRVGRYDGFPTRHGDISRDRKNR
ncbi:hypothetical protein ES703_44395 [subsurface metagenome]